MKKLIVLLIALMPMLTFAQDATSPKRRFEISVDPADLLTATIPVRFSVGVADRVALGISAYGRFFSFGGIKTLGVGGGIEAKFFLTGQRFEDSWYIKPAVQAGYLSMGTLAAPSVGGALTAGYNWVWDSGFSIEFGLGLQYNHWFASESTTESTLGITGIWPSIDFALGFAF